MAAKKRKKKPTEMDLLIEENKRLRWRAQMLRKLRSVRLITVKEPHSQKVLGVYTIPTFVYERDFDKIMALKDKFLMQYNQLFEVEVPIICDTTLGLEFELNELNQVDEKTEE